MDLPELPDRLVDAAAEALHRACCDGDYWANVDPQIRHAHNLGYHHHDAKIVLDATRAGLHAVSLRWAADRVQAECLSGGDDDCGCAATHYAAQLDAWANAASPSDGPGQPADEPATPTRTPGTRRARNLVRRRQEAPR